MNYEQAINVVESDLPVVLVDAVEAARLVRVGRGHFDILVGDGLIRPKSATTRKRLFLLPDVLRLRRVMEEKRESKGRPARAA